MPLLTEEEKAQLNGMALDRLPGFLLFAEGELTKEVFLIIKGHVKVTSGGADHIVAVRGPGDVVGEMAALDGKPRSASVYALQDITVQVISQQQWVDFLYNNPRVFHALVQMLSARVREATSKQSRASWFGVEQRLALGLLELARKLGKTDERSIRIEDVSQKELAGLVGASRESVSQVMRAFRRRGLVATGRELITVLNPEQLKEIADGAATALQTGGES